MSDTPPKEFYLLERSKDLVGYKWHNRIMELEREGWVQAEQHPSSILFSRVVGGHP